MVARRVVYAVFLAAAFLYYILYTTYISWVLLAVAVVLPVLSVLLAALLARGKCRVKLTHSAGAGAPGGFCVYAELQSSAQAVSVRLVLKMKNLLTGDVTVSKQFLVPGKRVEIPYESKLCGLIQIQAKRPKMMDLLGIIGMPAGEGQSMEVLLLPEGIPFESAPEALVSAQPEELHDSQGPQGGMETREWKDVREYRQGDMMRDIHWKLSARRGRLVVREFEKAGNDRATIAFESGDSPGQVHEAAARLIGLARRFHRTGYGLTVLWDHMGNTREHTVSDEKTLENLLRDMMKAHIRRSAGGRDAGAMERKPAAVPAQTADGREWLLVSPGAVVRYSGDVPMGEVN